MTIVNFQVDVDFESGEAKVLPIEKQLFLHGENDIAVLDILSDIQYDLSAMYIKKLKSFHENIGDGK